MNSTKTLSAEKRYSNQPFFRFTLKNNWQHFALYFIIMLLAIVLPCVMMINEYVTEQRSASYFEDIFTTCGVSSMFTAIAIAVFSGMSAISYVNSKQMVGCYHSFPIRREGLFLIETSVRAIYYLVSYLFCSAMVMALVNINCPMTPELNIVYLKMTLSSLFIYFLLYAIILFAGGLTGTAPVRLIMTLVILYLPVALYAILVLNAYVGIQNLTSEYYLSGGVLRVLCSTYRVAEAIGHMDSTKTPEMFYNIFWCIPEFIVYYGGAFLLHKYRKSESSGTTIIWKPVFLATKYIVIFAAALLGIAVFGTDWVFGSTNDSSLWKIFGLIFGAVISFMLVNAILYRSSKAIFKNLGGLAIVSALAAVVMVILPMDAFGLKDKIYDASATESLEISEIVFEDEEDTETFVQLLRESKTSLDGGMRNAIYLWNDDPAQADALNKEFGYLIADSQANAQPVEDEYRDCYDFGYHNETYIDIIQKPKFGIPLAKRVYIDMNDVFWDTFSRTDELKADKDKLTQVDISQVYGLDIQLGNFREYVDFYAFYTYDEQTTSYAIRETAAVDRASSEGFARYDTPEVLAVRDLLADIIPLLQYDSTKRDTGVIVGSLQLSLNNYYPDAYPIYAEDLDILNAVCRMINELYKKSIDYTPYPEFHSADEYFDHYIEHSLRKVAIIDSETGEIRSMPTEVFRDIVGDMPFFMGNSYYRFNKHLRVQDSRYWFSLSFGKTEEGELMAGGANTRIHYIRSDTLTDAALADFFARSK